MYIPQERILLDQHFTDATEALTKIGEYLVNQEIVSLPYVKSLCVAIKSRCLHRQLCGIAPCGRRSPAMDQGRRTLFDPSA